MPDFLAYLLEALGQRFRRPIPDFEKRVQKTQDDRNGVGNKRFQAPWVAAQPSVLTVSGR